MSRILSGYERHRIKEDVQRRMEEQEARDEARREFQERVNRRGGYKPASFEEVFETAFGTPPHETLDDTFVRTAVDKIGGRLDKLETAVKEVRKTIDRILATDTSVTNKPAYVGNVLDGKTLPKGEWTPKVDTAKTVTSMPHPKARRIDPDTRAKIKRLHKRGWNFTAIGASVGFSAAAVSRCVKDKTYQEVK